MAPWILWGAVAFNIVSALLYLHGRRDYRALVTQYQRYVQTLEAVVAYYEQKETP